MFEHVLPNRTAHAPPSDAVLLLHRCLLHNQPLLRHTQQQHLHLKHQRRQQQQRTERQQQQQRLTERVCMILWRGMTLSFPAAAAHSTAAAPLHPTATAAPQAQAQWWLNTPQHSVWGLLLLLLLLLQHHRSSSSHQNLAQTCPTALSLPFPSSSSSKTVTFQQQQQQMHRSFCGQQQQQKVGRRGLRLTVACWGRLRHWPRHRLGRGRACAA
jgi:hypothetical protein